MITNDQEASTRMGELRTFAHQNMFRKKHGENFELYYEPRWARVLLSGHSFVRSRLTSTS